MQKKRKNFFFVFSDLIIVLSIAKISTKNKGNIKVQNICCHKRIQLLVNSIVHLLHISHRSNTITLFTVFPSFTYHISFYLHLISYLQLFFWKPIPIYSQAIGLVVTTATIQPLLFWFCPSWNFSLNIFSMKYSCEMYFYLEFDNLSLSN